VSGLDWTLDGRIVYTSTESGGPDIWIMDADGENAKQLTVDSTNKSTSHVSPDGRYVVFASDRTGTRELWRIDTDGGNALQLTKNASPLPGALLDAGKSVYFTSLAGAERKNFRVSIDGGEPTPASRFSAAGAELPMMTFGAASPDGTVVAVSYRDVEQRRFRVAVLSADGRILVRGWNFPDKTRWSADGRAIHYTDARDGVWNIWSRPLDGRTPRQITKFTGSDQIFNFAWSRDGKRLALSRGTSTTDVVLMSNLP
jgi:WD40 repeat protein